MISIQELISMWDSSKVEQLLDGAMKTLLPYIQDIPTEKIVINAFSIFTQVTIQSISAVARLCDILVNLFSQLNIYETLKRWLGYLVEILKSVSMSVLAPIISYLKQIVLLFHTDNDMSVERGINIAIMSMKQHPRGIHKQVLELSRQTFLLTDTFCFYACVDKIREGHLPFMREVSRVLREWFSVARANNPHPFTESQVFAILKLSQDTLQRSALKQLYDNGVYDFHELAYHCTSEFVLRSAKNLKLFFSRLHYLSLDIIQGHYVDTNFISQVDRDYARNNPKQFYTLGDILEFEPFSRVKTVEFPFDLETIGKAFNYEVRSVLYSHFKAITPITLQGTFLRMHDRHKGRMFVLDNTLEILEAYCISLYNMNTAQTIIGNLMVDIHQYPIILKKMTDEEESAKNIGMKRAESALAAMSAPPRRSYDVNLKEVDRLPELYSSIAEKRAAQKDESFVEAAEKRKLLDYKDVAASIATQIAKITPPFQQYMGNGEIFFQHHLYYIKRVLEQEDFEALNKYRDDLTAYIVELKDTKIPELLNAVLDVSETPKLGILSVPDSVKGSLLVEKIMRAVRLNLANNIMRRVWLDIESPARRTDTIMSNATYREFISYLAQWLDQQASLASNTADYIIDLTFRRAVLATRLKANATTTQQFAFMCFGLAAVSIAVYQGYTPDSSLAFWWEREVSSGNIFYIGWDAAVAGGSKVFELGGNALSSAASYLPSFLYSPEEVAPQVFSTSLVADFNFTHSVFDFFKFILQKPFISAGSLARLLYSSGVISSLNGTFTLLLEFLSRRVLKYNIRGSATTDSTYDFVKELYQFTDPDSVEFVGFLEQSSFSVDAEVSRFIRILHSSMLLLTSIAAAAYVGDTARALFIAGTEFVTSAALLGAIFSAVTVPILSVVMGPAVILGGGLVLMQKVLSGINQIITKRREQVKPTITSVYDLTGTAYGNLKRTIFNAYTGTTDEILEVYVQRYKALKESLVEFTTREQSLVLDPAKYINSPHPWYLNVSFRQLTKIENNMYELYKFSPAEFNAKTIQYLNETTSTGVNQFPINKLYTLSNVVVQPPIVSRSSSSLLSLKPARTPIVEEESEDDDSDESNSSPTPMRLSYKPPPSPIPSSSTSISRPKPIPVRSTQPSEKDKTEFRSPFRRSKFSRD